MRGYFERVPSPPGEVLTPVVIEPRSQVQLVDDRDLHVAIEFAFGGYVSKPGAAKHPRTFDELDKSINDVRIVVQAAFAVMYRLRKGETPNQAQLSSFAARNGLLTLTPYWREFLDASLRRTGFPPVMAPVFNFEPGKSLESTRKRERR
jgi:hypothetical protein